jgi:hypothetical protein
MINERTYIVETQADVRKLLDSGLVKKDNWVVVHNNHLKCNEVHHNALRVDDIGLRILLRFGKINEGQMKDSFLLQKIY